MGWINRYSIAARTSSDRHSHAPTLDAMTAAGFKRAFVASIIIPVSFQGLVHDRITQFTVELDSSSPKYDLMSSQPSCPNRTETVNVNIWFHYSKALYRVCTLCTAWLSSASINLDRYNSNAEARSTTRKRGQVFPPNFRGTMQQGLISQILCCNQLLPSKCIQEYVVIQSTVGK